MYSDSPYEPPQSTLVEEHSSKMCRNGKYTVVDPEVEWPSRCFKCNADTDLRKKTKFSYLNPWFYLSILINIVVMLVLSLIFSKKFTIDMPLCQQHMDKRKKFSIFQWSLVGGMILASVAAGVTGNVVLVVAAILMLLVVMLSAIFGRLAFAAKYKDGNIWIKGGGEQFLDSLPELAT